MIRAAVFDVDGTLLDSMPIWDDLGVRYLRKLKIEPEEGLGDILFSMSMKEGTTYLRDHYGLTQTREEIENGILEMVRDFYIHEAPLKEGAAQFLEKLRQKGIPMAVATSSDRALIEAAFVRLGIFTYFEGLFTCTEIGEGKESPAIYQKASELLNAKPEETWVFEDALHALRTAKNAGFHTVALPDAASEKDRSGIRNTAELYLESLTEFDLFWKRASM